MANRVLAILIASRVQATEVDVVYPIVRLGFVKQTGCAGSSTEESITRFQRLRNLEQVEESPHLRVCLKLTVNVAGPSLDEIVAINFKELYIFQSSLVKFVHGEVIDGVDRISSITLWTSVP